jgi:hypothetical protein
MKQPLAEQFKSYLLQSEAVLWFGHPKAYRPHFHFPPGLTIITFIFIGLEITKAIMGDILAMIIVLGLVLFCVLVRRRQAEPELTLVLTNKRLLVFKGKGQLLRTHELNDVQIQRLGKDVFVVNEKINSDETIKWPCVCSEHPELLAIELQKIGAIKDQAA